MIKEDVLLLLFYLLSFVISANPPIPEKMYEVIETPPTLVAPSSNKFKRLDSSSYIEIQNSTLVSNIYDDYRIEKHQLILVPKNLQDNSRFSSWGMTLSNINEFEDVNVTCLILNSTENCNATKEISKDGEYNNCEFKFSFKLYNYNQLIVEYTQKIRKSSKEILYKIESIRIPILSRSQFCDYKYTIPDGYKLLGFREDLLIKESDKVFTYKGECPTESKNDVIRFTPEQSMWKSMTGFYLVSSTEFQNSINMIFTRYYRGGKNINSYYRIFSTQRNEFNEEEIVDDYTKLKVEIPAANTKKLGVELYTAFTNKLSNEFNVYFPESFYEIDEDSIDEDIKAKANEIINNSTYYPGKPNYYKLGKFVNNYMTYDLDYTGHDFTAKQIFEQKTGVCEHYTILYNAMLNAIGIKTLYVTGWAFQNNETFANEDTIGHAWTAALIDDKWMELDSTWGLFEGIPSGHILRGFFKSGVSYSWRENKDNNISYEEDLNITMITDESELEDPFGDIEETNPSDFNKTESSTESPLPDTNIEKTENPSGDNPIIDPDSDATNRTTESITTNRVTESVTTNEITESVITNTENQTTTNEVIENSTSKEITENISTNEAVLNQTTEEITENIANNTNTENPTTNKVSEIDITNEVDESNSTDEVYENITTDDVSENKTTDNVSENITNNTIISSDNTTIDTSNVNSTTTNEKVIIPLQIQIIDNKLIIFILSNYAMAKTQIFIFIIRVYTYNSGRFLQEYEDKKMEFTLPNNYDGSINKIIELTSKDDANENSKAVLVGSDNNNEFEVKLSNNKDNYDTEKVKELIKNGGANYSEIASNPSHKIYQYKIASSTEGCDFYINSNEEIKNSSLKNIDLNFIEIDDMDSNITAKCTLSESN